MNIFEEHYPHTWPSIPKLYDFIKEFELISENDFKKVIAKINIKGNEQYKFYENLIGIYEKLCFINKLVELEEEFQNEIITHNSTQIYLLLSCIDALSSNNPFKPLHEYLTEIEDKLFTKKEILKLYTNYLDDYGNGKHFKESFRHLIPLGLVEKFESINKCPDKIRKILLNQPEKMCDYIDITSDKYKSMSEIEKCIVIGDFFYRYYRNPYTHKGINPLHQTSSLLRKSFRQTLQIESDVESTFSIGINIELGFLGGQIKGDVIEHLDKLARYIFALKFKELHQILNL